MQSLYRIIKNERIVYGQNGILVADIKIENHIEEENPEDIFNDEVTEDLQTTTVIDIEKLREEIREQLYMENEEERLALIEKTIEEAGKEADRLKQEAIKEGYKEGLQAGYKKGVQECKVECDKMKASALALIHQAEEEVKSYFADNKDKIIQLAGDMAECIVNNTVDLSDENILLLIKPVIQLYEDNENIIITCAPENEEFLRSNVDKLEKINNKARYIILRDGNLERNNCIVENENQIVDLQIKKQITSIIDDIKNMED